MRYILLSIVVLIAIFLLSTGFFASAGNPPVSRQLSKKGLLQDLNFLNVAIKKGHPVNYKSEKVTLKRLIDSVSAIDADSLSKGEYRLIIGKALSIIGCVHTSIASNPTLEKVPVYYLPLKVNFVGGRLYYTGKASTQLKQGAEIKQINNVPAGNILNAIKYYAPSDGGSHAFAVQYIELMPTQLISLYFTYPQKYKLTFTSGDTLTLPGIKVPFVSKSSQPTESDLKLTSIDQLTGLLKVSAFNSSQNFDEVFGQINTVQYKNLVIDLRGNTGGDRGAAVAMVKHLVNQPFSYQIIQPKRLHPYSVLNGKGKTYYMLSLLKYNVGNFFKCTNTDLGRTYTYSYTPAENPFKGKIYVITDGFTASSASMATSWLKQYSNATFIGRQSGGGYNGNNGGSFPLITLPYSKMEIRFPLYRLVFDARSEKTDGIKPDYNVDYTLEDLIMGKDMDLEVVKALVK